MESTLSAVACPGSLRAGVGLWWWNGRQGSSGLPNPACNVRCSSDSTDDVGHRLRIGVEGGGEPGDGRWASGAGDYTEQLQEIYCELWEHKLYSNAGLRRCSERAEGASRLSFRGF